MKGSFLYKNFSVGPSYHRWMTLTPPTLSLAHRTSGRPLDGDSLHFVLPSRSWDLKWLETSENSNNSKKFTEFLTKKTWIWKEKTPFSKSFLCEKQTKKKQPTTNISRIKKFNHLPNFQDSFETWSCCRSFWFSCCKAFIGSASSFRSKMSNEVMVTGQNIPKKIPNLNEGQGGDLACPYNFCCPQVVGNNTSKKVVDKRTSRSTSIS